MAGWKRPDASATAHSKLCGSTVTVDLKMDGDTVSDFAHEVKACALGPGVLLDHGAQRGRREGRRTQGLRETVRKMLKENGAPPADGKWADIAVLEPVRDYKARHASTLLTFDAVVDAINQIEAKRGGGATPGGRSRMNLLHAPRLAGRGLVKVYRYTLSPLVGFHCRHLPTCSEYADEALDRYGLWAGSWMTLARLLRCQPVGHVGHRPRAGDAPQGARWYAPWRYARWSWRSREQICPTGPSFRDHAQRTD